MTALVASVFAAGLLGSVHCAAMCGSFACLASGGDASPGRAALRSSAAYNLGRLLSYAALGSLAGAAGAGLDRAGAVAGLTRPAAIVAGVLLIVWGLATLLATLGVRVPVLDVPPALAGRVAGALRAVQSRPPAVRGVAIGALSAALPCGWLYAFVAAAGGTGSPLRGAAVMALFWAGTLPVMASLGLGLQRLAGPLRTRLPLVTAVAVVAIGLLSIAGRLRPHPMRAPRAAVPSAHADPR